MAKYTALFVAGTVSCYLSYTQTQCMSDKWNTDRANIMLQEWLKKVDSGLSAVAILCKPKVGKCTEGANLIQP